ncbi:MAG TPA: hypothetical protein VK783_00900 [Bacteroidia bacterium]|nr:hypothetical protein [Bacteroidia bacterium]
MKHTEKMPPQVRDKLKILFPNSEAVFIKATQNMILKADRCTCDVPVIVYYARIPNTYRYKCKRCRKVVSPLVITPLGRERRDLTETVELACRFYFAKKELPPVIISELYQCKYETAKRKSGRVIQWMRLALVNYDNTQITEHINNTKVIRIFSSRYSDFTSAMDALFHALPSLGEAINKSNK